MRRVAWQSFPLLAVAVFLAAPVAATPSPVPVLNFLALPDDGVTTPAGAEGAVGPDHVFTTLNGQFRIHSKVGAALATQSSDTFFGLPAGSIVRPHAAYDPVAGRFIVVAVANVGSSTSAVELAVSRTGDPSGLWWLFSIPADSTGTNAANGPRVGFNASWIVVSVNMFSVAGSTFAGTKTLVFDKAKALAGTGGGAHSEFTTGTGTASLVPATMYGGDASTLYLLESHGLTSAFHLFEVSGAVGAETFTRLTDVDASSLGAWADTTTSSSGGFVPQSGTTELIDSGDARVQSLVFRNGTLWAAQDVFLPSASPTHAAVQWIEIDPTTSTLRQGGRIEDTTATATSGFHFMYGSLAVNKNDDVLVGFSRSAKTSFIDAGYVMRYAWDAPGTTRDVDAYKLGGASYDKPTGGRNRWGEYSKATVDPTDDLTFWTVQEAAASPANTWTTQWASVKPIVCSGTVSGGDCSDANRCALGPKTCVSGVCTGTGSVTCTALDECHAAGTCDSASGICSDPTVTDGTPCTSGTCVAGVCTPTGSDAGTDTAVDAAIDSAVDVGLDTSIDATSDTTTVDASSDSTADVVTDSIGDAATDTRPKTDAADAADGSAIDSASDVSSGADSGSESQSSDSGGCGCRTTPAMNGSAVAAIAFAAGLAITRRRRRRRVADR